MPRQQVVDAQCRVVPGEAFEDVVVEPRPVAHLDRPADVGRGAIQKLVQAGDIAPPGPSWPARLSGCVRTSIG